MLRLLGLRLDPSATEFGAVLRAKSSIIDTALNTQIRVDEARLRARQADELLPRLLEQLKAEQARLDALRKSGAFRTHWDDGPPILMAPPEDDSAA